MIGGYLSQTFGYTLFMILAAVVLTLGAVVTVVCFALLAHHMLSSRRRQYRAALVARAIKLLAPVVATGGDLDLAVADARRRVGDRAVAEVLRRARLELKGAVASQLSRLLSEMGETSRLAQEARSRRTWKRTAAIRGLGECGGDQACNYLITAAQDPQPAVRRAARDALLSDRREESVRAAVISFLDDVPKRSGWRREFYSRLASVASGALLDLTTSGKLEPREEKLALEALGDVRERRAIPHARARLSAEDAELRATAVRVLGKLGDIESEQSMVRLLDDPESFVRSTAARAIEAIPAQASTLDALGKRLTDPVWWVRANAAHTLAHKGEDGAQILVEIMEGSDRYAQQISISALTHVNFSRAIQERLEQLLPRFSSDPETGAMLALLRTAQGAAQ
ncbi:MAG: HEAT repeat domain-containing protein [Acidobacteriota bacterium]